MTRVDAEAQRALLGGEADQEAARAAAEAERCHAEAERLAREAMEMIERVLSEDQPREITFGRGDDPYKKL